jgi:DNA polymerase III epsilon subunit-like protein
MQFMDDGIFVAHNVNFDYGFISRECERLDRRFRFPKLCTVAGMRRRYPGHKSYGLGKLCELYEIELETHHRALCDARATGGLILGIDRLAARANAGFVSGRYDVDGMTLYVNNGTALWPGFALRLGRPSELPRITLRQAGAG